MIAPDREIFLRTITLKKSMKTPSNLRIQQHKATCNPDHIQVLPDNELSPGQVTLVHQDEFGIPCLLTLSPYLIVKTNFVSLQK